MASNSNLGIRAKLEPEVDKSSQNRMVRDLEKDIEQVEKLQFEDDGFRSRTTPGGKGGGGGGGMGAGFAGGRLASRGGGLSSLGGAAGGGMAAGAAVIGTVGLGGVLANKMYTAMSDASGKLQAVNSMWGAAIKNYIAPFGNAFADITGEDVKSFLDRSTEFYKTANQEGLAIASADLALDLAASDVGDWLLPSGMSSVADAFNDVPWPKILSNVPWTKIVKDLAWNSFVDQLEWSAWITGRLMWGDWVSKIEWGAWIDVLSKTDIIDHVFGNINIAERDVVGSIFGDISIGTSLITDLLKQALGDGFESPTLPWEQDSSTSSETNSSPSGGNQTPGGNSKNRNSPTRGSGSTGGSGGGDVPVALPPDLTVENKLDLDGRRLFEGVTREQEDLFRRI